MVLIPGKSNGSDRDIKPIYARSGWEIPQETLQIDAALLRIRSSEIGKWRPKAVLRSLSNYPYNCVGLVFAARRAWIEIDYVYDILREDQYRRIERNQVLEGDVVLYRFNNEASHVALILSVERLGSALNIKTLSKWGKEGEFIHFEEDVPPFCGKPVEYYTERESQ